MRDILVHLHWEQNGYSYIHIANVIKGPPKGYCNSIIMEYMGNDNRRCHKKRRVR